MSDAVTTHFPSRDLDIAMSDDFDKEAEREKLREKYEKDKRKREATEQMSELLLKGATMTNAHCSACSDPIFRYDGQEFCPTCEKPVDRGTGEEDADDETDEDEAIEVTTPSDEARVSFGEDENGEQANQRASRADETTAEGGPQQRDQEVAASEGSQSGEPTQGSEESPAVGSSGKRRTAERATIDHQQQTRQVPSVDPGSEDIEGARQSLIRTLTHFSQQAEATNDPRRAKEHLEAAREAAETLAALRRS